MFHSSVTYWQDTGIVQSHTHRKPLKSYEEAEISIGLEIAWSMLGGGYYLRGEYEKAIDAGEKSLKLAKEFGMPFIGIMVLLVPCYDS